MVQDWGETEKVGGARARVRGERDSGRVKNGWRGEGG